MRRVAEEEYRALAARAVAWLARPSARGEAPAAVPAIVAAADARVVVVDAGRREIGLFPVAGGRVIDAAAVSSSPADVDAAVARLDWTGGEGGDDWPWLAAWLRSRRSLASYVVADEAAGPEGLAAAVRAALPPRFAAPAPGDNVGATRGET
jgi:hypothetical protein